MTCREAELLLGALLDGELEDDRKWQVEAHLEKCDRCRMAKEELKTLHRLTTTAELVPEPPPDYFEDLPDNVLRRVGLVAGTERESMKFSWRIPSPARNPLSWGLAAAAVLVLLVVGGDLLQRNRVRPPREQQLSSRGERQGSQRSISPQAEHAPGVAVSEGAVSQSGEGKTGSVPAAESKSAMHETTPEGGGKLLAKSAPAQAPEADRKQPAREATQPTSNALNRSRGLEAGAEGVAAVAAGEVEAAEQPQASSEDRAEEDKTERSSAAALPAPKTYASAIWMSQAQTRPEERERVWRGFLASQPDSVYRRLGLARLASALVEIAEERPDAAHVRRSLEFMEAHSAELRQMVGTEYDLRVNKLRALLKNATPPDEAGHRP